MKLSAYAKQVGITYKTAWQWWKAGQLDAYQRPTGTIIVREPQTVASGVALYARVSSADQKDDAVRQMQRLRDYAAARGYQVVAEVIEIASGLNEERPQLKKLLTDARIGVLVVEHRDRLVDRRQLSHLRCLRSPGRASLVVCSLAWPWPESSRMN